MIALTQNEVIAIIIGVVVIAAIIGGRGLRISRKQLILDPKRTPAPKSSADVLTDARITGSKLGNVTGVAGSGAADANILNRSEIKDSEVKDITGVSASGSRK